MNQAGARFSGGSSPETPIILGMRHVFDFLNQMGFMTTTCLDFLMTALPPRGRSSQAWRRS